METFYLKASRLSTLRLCWLPPCVRTGSCWWARWRGRGTGPPCCPARPPSPAAPGPRTTSRSTWPRPRAASSSWTSTATSSARWAAMLSSSAEHVRTTSHLPTFAPRWLHTQLWLVNSISEVWSCEGARLFEHAPADTGWKDTELKRLLNVKTLVNQEKALVEAFSVVSRNLRLFYALKDSMSQVTFAPDTAITDLQWNCEKFNMEERDSDLAAASEPRQQPAPSSASASRLCVLAICFRNGDIKLVTSYDDVSPVVSRARNEPPRRPRHNQIEDIMNYEYISSLFGPASRRCRRSGPTLVIINWLSIIFLMCVKINLDSDHAETICISIQYLQSDGD